MFANFLFKKQKQQEKKSTDYPNKKSAELRKNKRISDEDYLREVAIIMEATKKMHPEHPEQDKYVKNAVETYNKILESVDGISRKAAAIWAVALSAKSAEQIKHNVNALKSYGKVKNKIDKNDYLKESIRYTKLYVDLHKDKVLKMIYDLKLKFPYRKEIFTLMYEIAKRENLNNPMDKTIEVAIPVLQEIISDTDYLEANTDIKDVPTGIAMPVSVRFHHLLNELNKLNELSGTSLYEHIKNRKEDILGLTELHFILSSNYPSYTQLFITNLYNERSNDKVAFLALYNHVMSLNKNAIEKFKLKEIKKQLIKEHYILLKHGKLIGIDTKYYAGVDSWLSAISTTAGAGADIVKSINDLKIAKDTNKTNLKISANNLAAIEKSGQYNLEAAKLALQAEKEKTQQEGLRTQQAAYIASRTTGQAPSSPDKTKIIIISSVLGVLVVGGIITFAVILSKNKNKLN